MRLRVLVNRVFRYRRGMITALAAGWLWVANVATAIQIRVYPPVPQPGSVVRLEVTGQWPNTCVPKLSHASLADGRFKVHATVNGIDCQDEPTSFRLDTVLGYWNYTLMAASGFYPVEFYVQTRPDLPPHLYAFNVIRADRTPTVRLLPENGFWWVDEAGLYGQAGHGSGLTIDRQGNQMIVTIQSYTADGQPVWYFAEGQLVNGVFQADYHQIVGGAPLYTAGNRPREVHKMGRLILTFDNQQHGTLWLLPEFTHLPEQGIAVFPVSIRRYLSSATATEDFLQGQWVLVGAAPGAKSVIQAGGGGDSLFLHKGRYLNTEENKKSRVLDFTASDQRALRCYLDTDSHIHQCFLLSPEGRKLAVFDDVGVMRLRGRWQTSGDAVSLVREE